VSAAGLPRLRVGISACLLGHPVRYDGGHKRDRFAVEVLAAFVDFVPVCPEVEIGLGVPRPPIRLEGTPDRPRLIDPASGRDLTDAMQAYAAAKLEELAAADLDGYVLKASSPSCGLERVELVPGDALAPGHDGVGLFAAALLRRLPELPVEEEKQLTDARRRAHFVERLFAYRRARRRREARWGPEAEVRLRATYVDAMARLAAVEVDP
jgi:uncharacterized protein YbbK (DUF523 family)